MDFITAVKTCMNKYATFQGRARRAEFWYFMLFQLLGTIATSIIDAGVGLPVLGPLFSLAMFIPGIAVAVRRLHDTDRTGWWWWLFLVPLVGVIVLLIWYASRGTIGTNRFGDDPLVADQTGGALTV